MLQRAPRARAPSFWDYARRFGGPAAVAAGAAGTAAYRHYFPSYGKPVAGVKRLRSGKVVRKTTKRAQRVTTGSHIKRASRKRKIRRDPYKLHGSEKTIEKGGIVTPAVIASFGHSNLPLYEVYLSVGRAIWRALMKKHGVCFSDWGSIFNANLDFDFTMEYRLAPNGVALMINGPAYLTQLTHLAWAVRVTGVLFDALATTDDQLIINKFYCTDQLEVGPPVKTLRICELDLTNSTLHLRLASDMVMQNRTLGQGMGDDQTTDVTNNPISGRSWTVTGNGMMPLTNKQMSAETVAHQEYGSIFGSQNVTSQGPSVTFEPNSAQTYKFAVGSAKQRIMPGQISRSKLYSVYKLSLQQFVEKTKEYLAQNTSISAVNVLRVPLGKSRMFSFEKVCDTGGGDQKVTLGYEINNTVSSYITVKFPYTNRIGQKF